MINLRALEPTDQELLVEYLNNPLVVKYLSSKVPYPYTIDDAQWWIDIGSKENAIVKAIEVDGVFCGVIGVYNQPFEYSHCAEIGYWLGHQYWDQGITTHALSEFTRFIFCSTTITRIFNPVSSPNTASMRVLEKAGYTLEGIMRQSVSKDGQYSDEHLYAKIKPI